MSAGNSAAILKTLSCYDMIDSNHKKHGDETKRKAFKTMKMKKIKYGYMIGVLVILCVIVFCLVYTRPMTMGQRFAYLDFSQCTGIGGYYSADPSAEQVPFVITPEDPRFNEMIDVIRSTAFRARIKNLFPQGTRVHRYTEGEYQWELEFCFDRLPLPDGSTSSGSVLSFQNFFGDLTSTVNGEIVFCTVKGEAQWTKRIMDLIARDG